MTDPTSPTPPRDTPTGDPWGIRSRELTDEEARRLLEAIMATPRHPYLAPAAVLLAILAGLAGLLRVLRARRAVRR